MLRESHPEPPTKKQVLSIDPLIIGLFNEVLSTIYANMEECLVDCV
jgi:hypothetical protein